jgi:hypothetical protein
MKRKFPTDLVAMTLLVILSAAAFLYLGFVERNLSGIATQSPIDNIKTGELAYDLQLADTYINDAYQNVLGVEPNWIIVNGRIFDANSVLNGALESIKERRRVFEAFGKKLSDSEISDVNKIRDISNNARLTLNKIRDVSGDPYQLREIVPNTLQTLDKIENQLKAMYVAQ